MVDGEIGIFEEATDFPLLVFPHLRIGDRRCDATDGRGKAA